MWRVCTFGISQLAEWGWPVALTTVLLLITYVHDSKFASITILAAHGWLTAF